MSIFVAIYDKVVEILTSLGIDNTFYYQFVIFFVAYLAMDFIVFRPYLAAFNERQKRTVGDEEDAKKILEHADKVEDVYRAEARELNDKVKDIFSEKSQKASQEKAQILEQARKDADSKIDSGRNALDKAMQEARNTIEQHIPEISQKIESKFLGKQ